MEGRGGEGEEARRSDGGRQSTPLYCPSYIEMCTKLPPKYGPISIQATWVCPKLSPELSRKVRHTVHVLGADQCSIYCTFTVPILTRLFQYCVGPRICLSELAFLVRSVGVTTSMELSAVPLNTHTTLKGQNRKVAVNISIN